jgi:ligand-binding sensor domain-containing protein
MDKKTLIGKIAPGLLLAVIGFGAAARAQNWTSFTNFNPALKLAADPSSPGLWGATPGGAVLFSWQDTLLTARYDNTNGLPVVELTSMALGPHGYKWFGTCGGGMARLDSAGTAWRVFNGIDGLLSDTVTALCSYQDYILAGTRQGLSFSNNGDSWPGISNNLIFPNLQEIKAIAQRNDTLWFATDIGLSRVSADSLINSRPLSWHRDSTFGLGSRNLQCIFLSDTISIIGTTAGAARWNGISWQPIPGLGGSVCDIAQQGDSIFFATSGGIRLYHQGSLTSINSGLLSTNAYSLAFDGLGRLWCGTELGLAVLQGSVWHSYHFDCINENDCFRVAVNSKNQPWVATRHQGLNHLNGGSWEHFNSASTVYPLEVSPSALFVDHANTLWYGTWGNGIYKCDDQGIWSHPSSGVPTPYIAYFLPDQTNGLYLAHWDSFENDLVSRFNFMDSTWQTFTNPLVDDLRPNALALDADGSLWVGSNRNGLFKKGLDNNWTSWNASNSMLPSTVVFSLLLEDQNNLWIGTDNGLAKYDGEKISLYPHPVLSGKIRAVKIDRANNKWIGTDRGLNLITWDGRVLSYTQQDLGNNGCRLVCDDIYDIAIAPIDERTDGIYLATAKGLSLLRYDLVLPRQALPVNVAPNPYRPGTDPCFFFSNLPSRAVVRIFTLDGRLLGIFDGPAAPGHILVIRPGDIRSKLVSGLYLCHISAPGSKQTVCKLAVIR